METHPEEKTTNKRKSIELDYQTNHGFYSFQLEKSEPLLKKPKTTHTINNEIITNSNNSNNSNNNDPTDLFLNI